MSSSKSQRSALVVIRGEICVIIASLRRNTRWASHQQESKSDIILRKLQALKETLDSGTRSTGVKITADANYFLVPFLDVIRSEETSGPVTALALSSIEKFIAYEIISESNGSGGAVEAITDAVIHAHFVSTDSASDELVLMKILNVLHRLFLSPLGPLLSNESVCELMQACFRMCFIDRANELLRKSAETALTDMIHLLFSRLHSFPTIESMKKPSSRLIQTQQTPTPHIVFEPPTPPKQEVVEEDTNDVELTTPSESKFCVETNDQPVEILPASELTVEETADTEVTSSDLAKDSSLPTIQVEESTPEKPVVVRSEDGEFKNSSGVKFTMTGDGLEKGYAPVEEEWTKPTVAPATNRAKITVPYGIPCVRELFRFLISLINPHDKQNTEVMIHLGLKLLLVSVETGIDALPKHTPVMSQVRNELCKNLIALLSYFPPSSSGTMASSSVLLSVLRILFIIFENLRHSLKYQLEVFLTKMGDLINESGGITGTGSGQQVQGKWNYEQREIALDFLIQLWKLPCFITELYLNYDCDLFGSNLFEDTTKLLSKNTFPLQTGINSTHLLCLDGLLSILDGIEGHCTVRMASNPNNSASSDDSNSSVFYHEDQAQPSNDHFFSRTALPSEESGGSISSPLPLPGKGYATNNNMIGVEETLLPTHEQLMAVRHKKKIYHTGSEHYNTKASKGIEFLQAHGILGVPLDPLEVASFLRENPLLDKRIIGDYISNRKHSDILHAFVCSFDFHKIRIDEALRVFLESFRLPGEAGPIALILEEFAAHWSAVNGNPFGNVDAAYILAYQVIMLNVDQHNSNVKKGGNSMTLEALKNNLRGCNNKEDFDPEMLKEIYNAIKSDEIIMPSEQAGLVKENYLWKVLLRRGNSSASKFQTPANDEGVFDHDLFSLSWGPIVAALSFIFDKTSDPNIITKSLTGFRKCATISAHYGMSDVFDNLVISLCKFTTLISGNPDISSNSKAQASCRQVFQLVHRHGDILREGWKNFVDCLISLFKLQVLPKILTEAEDFTEPSGRVSLIRRSQISVPRQETGFFSSLYSYVALSADSPGSKSSIAEEDENRKKSQVLIIECRPELLMSESKFLQMDSLLELVKALISASPVPESKRKDYDEDQTVFVMEVLLKISIQNRDRALAFWDVVKDHLFSIILATATNDMPYVLERATVGLLRVALRLMRKEDLCSIVLQSLKILLYLRPASVIQLSQQLSFGLHEILKTTAANIHTTDEWSIIFTVLEYVGAGKVPPTLLQTINAVSPSASTSNPGLDRSNSLGINTLPLSNGNRASVSSFPTTLHHSLSQDPIPQFANSGPIGYSSGSDRGYTSDSELEIKSSDSSSRLGNLSPTQSWILLTQEDQQLAAQGLPPSPRRSIHQPLLTSSPLPASIPERQLFYPDPKSLVKSCETLSFLVRDAAHITPDNFTLCVGAIRSFVEASTLKARPSHSHQQQGGKKKRSKKNNSDHSMSKSKSYPHSVSSAAYDADESDNEDQMAATQHVSIQLLDLLHTLHTRAAQIFQWWQKEISVTGGEEASLWSLGWKPLLQAIVILCSDSRKQVRTVALTYLQRALLVHDLQQLSPLEWQSCFNEVLFPLLSKLLEPLNPADGIGMEETRMRAATLLCKVFLQHLTPLLQLEGFTTLWLHILEFLDKYMHHTDRSELLIEAIPESLKNLLLVMETAGIFHTPEGYTKLWAMTWEKIDSFLPTLRAELIRSVPPVDQIIAQPAPSQATTQPQPQSYEAEERSSNLSLINANPPSDFVPVIFAQAEPTTVEVSPPETTSSSGSPVIESLLNQVIQNEGLPMFVTQGILDESESLARATSPALSSSGRLEYTSICFGEEEEALPTTQTVQLSSQAERSYSE